MFHISPMSFISLFLCKTATAIETSKNSLHSPTRTFHTRSSFHWSLQKLFAQYYMFRRTLQALIRLHGATVRPLNNDALPWDVRTVLIVNGTISCRYINLTTLERFAQCPYDLVRLQQSRNQDQVLNSCDLASFEFGRNTQSRGNG